MVDRGFDGEVSCNPALVELLVSGSRVEPLVEPKPGGVGRCVSHSDKSVFDFEVASMLVSVSAYESCASASRSCRSSIASGFRVYRRLHGLFLPRTNVYLGLLLLILPLSAALGLKEHNNVRGMIDAARDIVLYCTGPEEAREYYRLLEYLGPSHLGVYKGPIPGVGEGYPDSFVSILEAARWDHVHRELLDGYPLSLEAYGIIKESPGDLEGRVLNAILELLASYGDTLIASKYGWRAYKKALEEAKTAKTLSTKLGIRGALEWLDSLWRPRGWNPGSIYDIVAVGIGFYMLDRVLQINHTPDTSRR